MGEALGLLFEVLAKLGTVLGIVQAIQGLLGLAATEQTAAEILTLEQSTNNEVANSVWGTAAIHNQLISLSTQLADGITQLSTQMGHPMQSDATIPLPPTPPPGYGGPPAGDNANAVWSFVPAGQFEQMQTKMLSAGSLAEQLREFWPVPAPDNPFIALVFDWSNANALSVPAQSPDFDITQILPSDDILSWLNRIDTQGNVWSYNVKGVATSPGTFPESGFWQAMFTTDQFNAWKALLGTATTSTTAPVWPGLANVTLGATLTLADGLLVPGPLDGVIATITAVAYPSSFYPFGPIKSYVKVASIAFVDDDGQAEWPEPLSFEKHVVCPRSMVRADHAYCRVQTGTIGTVTPWTKI